MNVLVAVLSFNPLSNLRFELLTQTIESINEAFPSAEKWIFNNGSTDGSSAAMVQLLEAVRQAGRWGYSLHEPANNNTTPGAGRNWVLRSTKNPRHDLIVFSDDDMVWNPGAEEKLISFWKDAPTDLAIVSGLLEPDWHWNKPIEAIEAGGVRVLVRESAPAAAWTFRHTGRGIAEDFMGDHGDDVFVSDFGEDYEYCQRLRRRGLRVAQLDLATHIGHGYSTHGNDAAEHVDSRPLDREKWGI